MPNALAQETSPYLRQHAHNPVDWVAWGPEAFEDARRRNVPVLVSIGYSACHWCHVMERESFEDVATAAIMNEEFICVKVDREERPDVDAIYMDAVQGMTGHGGWPLNVFLTPEQLPFYGGTYYPPEPRHGMPAWTQVLQAIAESWRENGEQISAGGERLRAHLAGGAGLTPSEQPITTAELDGAVAALRLTFDASNGGFGPAPKFPQASVIEFLLARGELGIALETLRAMAAGGIHDQLGGGFARYSVDAAWTVPHFEKMLYDNALLARAYLHGWQASGDQALLEVCLGTLGWTIREMRGPEGAFYSALDADSEGVEGRYYVWTAEELRTLLGEDAQAAIDWLGVSAEGNFSDPHHPEPGLNVLTARGPEPPHRSGPGSARCCSLARSERVRPGLDDKRLTAWNALMIAALAETGAALQNGLPEGIEGPRARGLRRRMRRVPARADARRARTPAAHLQRRPRQDHGLSRGSRLPAGSADRPVRSLLRGALVHAGHRAGRRDDRPLRRSAGRRLLHDGKRRRTAHRSAQGPRGQPHAGGLLERRRGTAAPCPADRQRRVRTPRPFGAGAGARGWPGATPAPSDTFCR